MVLLLKIFFDFSGSTFSYICSLFEDVDEATGNSCGHEWAHIKHTDVKGQTLKKPPLNLRLVENKPNKILFWKQCPGDVCSENSLDSFFPLLSHSPSTFFFRRRRWSSRVAAEHGGFCSARGGFRSGEADGSWLISVLFHYSAHRLIAAACDFLVMLPCHYLSLCEVISDGEPDLQQPVTSHCSKATADEEKC